MGWMDHPASFQIPFRQLSPREIAVSAHQTTKKFRVMPLVKHDKSHAPQDALLHAVDQCVTDLIMGNVSPPEEYICIIEKLFAQTLIGIVNVANAYGETFVL